MARHYYKHELQNQRRNGKLIKCCLLVKLKAAQMEHTAVLSSKDSIQRGVTNPHTVGRSATAVKVLTGRNSILTFDCKLFRMVDLSL